MAGRLDLRAHENLLIIGNFQWCEMNVKSTMSVVFNDLQGPARDIQPALHAALRRVLDSGWYILGQELEGFEQEFAVYCTVQHCIGVGSGTEALHLALQGMRHWTRR